MCGIFGFFTNGLGIKLDKSVIIKAGREAQKRGNDGWGFMLNDSIIKTVKPKVFNIANNISKTSYGVLNARAKPETEPETSLNNIQPVFHVTSYNDKHYMVHNGSLSKGYNNEIFKKYNWNPESELDTEGLLCTVVNEGMKLEDIDGGFSFIHMVVKDKKLMEVNVSCKYQPLYVLEVSNQTGSAKFFHSLKSGIDIIKKYYDNGSYFMKEYEFEPYTYISYDLESETTTQGKFEPYFNYPNRHKEKNKIKILCSCSGGIDSTTSLIMAHKMMKETKQDFDIDLVHFNYGHRGGDAEYNAVTNIIRYLKEVKGIEVKLKLFNLEDIYKFGFNVKNSQLINKETIVETGTEEKLKSTIAWVPVRNMLFQTILTGLAETYILEEEYKKVYMIAGWNQLSEEGFYPDNSSRFSNTMLQAALFGTLVGHKMKTWNVCSQLLKSDQWLLAHALDFIDVFQYTISCDIPVQDGLKFYNCNGQCGSTLLSMWASKRYKDIKDPRTFKDVDVKLPNIYKLPKQEPIDVDKKSIASAINRLVKNDEIKYNLEKKLLK